MPPRRSALGAAVSKGNDELVSRLLSQGADVNEKDGDYDDRPLTLASFRGHYSTVQILCSKGAGIEQSNSTGDTPLILAARQGHLRIVKYLLKQCKANIAASNDKGFTATMMAYRHNHVRVGKHLEKNGGMVAADDKAGNTALHYSAYESSHSSLKYLLKNQKIDVNHVNKLGRTPIFSAVDSEDPDTVKIVLSYNPSLTVRCKNGDTPLSYCVRESKHDILPLFLETGNLQLDNKDKEGCTVLHIAAKNCNSNILNLLLQYQVPITAKNKTGQTAWDIAEQNGAEEICRMLNAKLQEKKRFGELLTYCSLGDFDSVKEMMKSWHKINSTDQNGNCPLISACKSEHIKMVEFLLKKGANIDIQNKKRETAMHVAVDKGNEELVDVLLEREPNMLRDINDELPIDSCKSRRIKRKLKQYVTDNPDAQPDESGNPPKRPRTQSPERNKGHASRYPLENPVLKSLQQSFLEHMKVHSDLLVRLITAEVIQHEDRSDIDEDKKPKGKVEKVLHFVDKCKNGLKAFANALEEDSKSANRNLGKLLLEKMEKEIQ